MATLKDAVSLTEQLNELSNQLHTELTEGDVDFEKMIQLADDISEQADGIAAAFTRMNEALTDPMGQNGSGGVGADGGQETSGQQESGQQESAPKPRARSKSGGANGGKRGEDGGS